MSDTPTTPEISINLQDLVGFLLRGLLPALLLAGIAGAAVYVLTQREEPVYRAEATLLVARTTAGFSQFGLSPVSAPPIEMSAYRAAAQSDRVMLDALALLGVEAAGNSDIRFLRNRSSTFLIGDGRDSSLLGIEARGETPDDAVARANAVADALVAWDQRRATDSLTRVITTLDQQINALGEQIRTLQSSPDAAATQTQVDGLIRLRAEQQQQQSYARALVASAEGLLSVMQPAGTTPRQIAPRPAMNAAIAALLALVLTYAFLLVRSALNTRLHSADDIATASGLTLLSEYPRGGGPQDEWRQQEATNYLRTNLLFATADAHPKVVVVTSAHEQEGKTTVACQLAEGLARNGYRTLLVDADLRSPTVAERYGFDGGESDVTTMRDWMVDTSSRGRNVLRVMLDSTIELFIVPQFWSATDPSGTLARGFPRALAQWDGYDAIVVDTAPVLSVADTLAIAPYCTGTILVVDAQRTDRRKLVAAKGLLERVGANIFGVVANKVRSSSRGSAYGAAYGATAKGRPRNVADPKGTFAHASRQRE